MNENKKGGKKNSDKSDSSAAGVSTEENVINKEKNDKTTSPSVTQKTTEVSGNCPATANISHHMTGKKQEKGDKYKTTFITDASEVKNWKKQAEESKQSGRRRGNSEPVASATKSIPSPGYDGKKRDSSSTLIDLSDLPAVMARIEEIEKGKGGAQPIKFLHGYKVHNSPTYVSKKKLSGEETVLTSSTDKELLFCTSESTKITSSGIVLKAVRSTKTSQKATSTLQNMPEDEKNIIKSASTTQAGMKSREEETKNEKDKEARKDMDNPTSNIQEMAPSAKKSKKKKRRSRRKTAPGILGAESLHDAEYEGNKPDCFDKDIDMRELNPTDVSTIKADPKSVKSMHDYKIQCPSSQEKKRKVTFNTEDESVQNSSEDNETKISDIIRPVIFMADKSTQTDQLPEPSCISKPTGDRNIAVQNLDSEGAVTTRVTDPALQIPPEEPKPENAGNNDNLKNLEAIKEEFLRDLKIAHENFKVGYIKCFQHDK